MIPSPTARLRFREMTDDDLDEMAAVLGAPDPARANDVTDLVAIIRPENLAHPRAPRPR